MRQGQCVYSVHSDQNNFFLQTNFFFKKKKYKSMLRCVCPDVSPSWQSADGLWQLRKSFVSAACWYVNELWQGATLLARRASPWRQGRSTL